MLRWSISYESHELLDVFVVRSTQFSSSIHFPLVNFTFCELPPIAIKTSPPLTTGPQQPSPVLLAALCRLNTKIRILLQFFLFLRQDCAESYVCLFDLGFRLFHLFVSCLQLQSRHQHHLLLDCVPQPSTVLLATLCQLNTALNFFSFVLFLRQSYMYIPSRIKTQMNLVPFCFWADWAVFGWMAVLKISAILLKYATLGCFSSSFHGRVMMAPYYSQCLW